MSDDKPLIIDPTVVKNWNTDDNPDGKALNLTIDVPKHLSFVQDALSALLMSRLKRDVMPRGYEYKIQGGIEEGRDCFHVTLKAESMDGRGRWAASESFRTEDIKAHHTNIPTKRGIDMGVANYVAPLLSHMIDHLIEELPLR